MSEEREKHSLQRQADRARPKSGSRSILVYLIVLFAAAALLILLAFFMQQRNEATLSDMRTSFESMDNLLEENSSLREKLDRAEDQIEELESQLSQARRRAEAAEAACEEEAEYESALFTLYCAEQKETQRDYEGAAALLLDFDLTRLNSILARYDGKADRPSEDALPLQPRLQALTEELTRRGYLDSGDEPEE